MGQSGVLPLPSAGESAKLTFSRIDNGRLAERKGKRKLWVASRRQNENFKRYSTTLVHNGRTHILFAYCLDGDNLPSASLKLTPPSPSKKRLSSNLNEPGPSDTSQSTNKPPELPSSIISDMSDGGLGNVEPAARRKRKPEVCDVPDETRKKQKTLERVASGAETAHVFRYGDHGGPAEGFAPQSIGNVVQGQLLSERPLSTRCVAFDPVFCKTLPD